VGEGVPYGGGATPSEHWEHGGQLWLTREEPLHCRFKAKFGLGWEEALAKGVVFNAMDACSEVRPACCKLSPRIQRTGEGVRVNVSLVLKKPYG